MAQADVESGARDGLTRAEREELVRLRRENRVLRVGEGDPGKSGGLLRHRERTSAELTFQLVEADKANYPIAVLCRTLGVSTSGFYAWRHAQSLPCARRVGDAELVERIRDIHHTSRRSYGSPQVFAELKLGEGRRVGRKRIERLMRINGIVGIHTRRRGCTRRDPDAVASDDLVNRQFRPEGPDRLWVSDVTEHPTAEGKVYLAVVIDAWSRRVIGWSIADHMRAELVVDALQMACWRRQPPAGQTVHHSDHGSQYTSWAFGRRLRAAGVLGSMGSIGDAYDNAMAESFFSIVQRELLDTRRWATRRELALAVFEWVEAWYNPHRRHTSIGSLSPIDFEAASHRETLEEAA